MNPVAIRKVFGAWLACWLIGPIMLLMLLSVVLTWITEGLHYIVVRYDARVKLALAKLDDWIKYGPEPME